MRAVLLALLRIYKLVLSPIVGGQCRFYPSCSEYAKQALERHSVVSAALMSAKRLLRCNPWHPGGVDMVQ